MTSLALPLEIGDGSYEIWVWDGEAFVLDGTTTAEGEFAVYELSEPSSRFQVRGIEPAAGLDPADPLAFPAGLAFASDGAVDFSMTALPEPGAGAATAAALLGLAVVGRCRRR